MGSNPTPSASFLRCLAPSAQRARLTGRRLISILHYMVNYGDQQLRLDHLTKCAEAVEAEAREEGKWRA